MTFEWQPVQNVSLGVNYRNLVGSVTSREGEAQDALNTYPREDGALYKSFGWSRKNATALEGRPISSQGFSYRGKNTAGGDTRPGNWGVANDGEDFNRRTNEYPGFLQLTSTHAYVWDPITETFTELVIPGGVTLNADLKPTIAVVQDNCYVVNWASQNLRFDPTDHVFYRWGWDDVPGEPSVTRLTGDLIEGALYQYGVTFLDIYTGEESKMSELVKVTGGTGYTIDVSALTYGGDRHHANDIAIVVWRTGADDNSPRFLKLLNPGTTSLVDDGLAREVSLRPFRGTQVDEPPFSALKEFKGKFYALSKLRNSTRLYFSYFDRLSYYERWVPLGFRDLPLDDGEVLTAVGGTDATFLTYSQRGSFRISISATLSQQQLVAQRMPWHVGCVGPQARETIDGWDYFLSERGPQRWKEGLTDPQPIGENLIPIFADPVSGMCKLVDTSKELSEVEYQAETNTVHFTFPTGTSAIVNNHMAYWNASDRNNGDYRLGWFPQSPLCQSMSLSSGLAGSALGTPDSPRAKQPALVWTDEAGYVYEYDPNQKRAGLEASEIAVTTVDSAPGAANEIDVPAADTLYTTGDGLIGLRVEVESLPDASGNTLTQVREIASNTASQIIVTEDFDTPIGVGDAVRIAGIPAFWRSWADHFGMPHQHKTVMDFSLGYQDRNNPEGLIVVRIGWGEFPETATVQRTAHMGKWRKKMTVSKTAVFFFYEFSNSMPDELFLITNFEREVQAVPGRRRA